MCSLANGVNPLRYRSNLLTHLIFCQARLPASQNLTVRLRAVCSEKPATLSAEPSVVPLAGLKPARPCCHLILSQARMTVAGGTTASDHSAMHCNDALNVADGSDPEVANLAGLCSFYPRKLP